MSNASMLVDKVNKEWNNLVLSYQNRTPLWLIHSAREIYMKNQIADTLISEVEDLGLDDDDMRRMAHSGDIIETIYKNYSRNSFDISDEACRRAIISTLGVYN